MRALRSILRWFFGLQAAVLILSPIAGLLIGFLKHAHARAAHIAPAHAARAASSLSGSSLLIGPMLGYGILAGAILIGAIFATAWWTTRKPSAALNLWALAASLLYLVEGAAYFVYSRRLGHPSNSGLDLVAIGLAGLFFFPPRENVPAPSAPKPPPIPGDRPSPLTRHAVTALSTVAQI